MQAIALAFLAAVAIGGVAWVFIYPLLSGEKQAENRRAAVARPEPAAKRQSEKTQRSRREQVEGTLKDLEARRAQQSKVPLTVRLSQAGLDKWTPNKFYVVSCGPHLSRRQSRAGAARSAARTLPSRPPSACRAGPSAS